jgi:hypothetical protein
VRQKPFSIAGLLQIAFLGERRKGRKKRFPLQQPFCTSKTTYRYVDSFLQAEAQVLPAL